MFTPLAQQTVSINHETNDISVNAGYFALLLRKANGLALTDGEGSSMKTAYVRKLREISTSAAFKGEISNEQFEEIRFATELLNQWIDVEYLLASQANV